MGFSCQVEPGDQTADSSAPSKALHEAPKINASRWDNLRTCSGILPKAKKGSQRALAAKLNGEVDEAMADSSAPSIAHHETRHKSQSRKFIIKGTIGGSYWKHQRLAIK